MLNFIIWFNLFALFMGALIGMWVLAGKAAKVLKGTVDFPGLWLWVAGVVLYVIWLQFIAVGGKLYAWFIPFAVIIDLLVGWQFLSLLISYLKLKKAKDDSEKKQ